MNDIKLYINKVQNIGLLIHLRRIYISDTGISFGLDVYTTVVSKGAKLWKLKGTDYQRATYHMSRRASNTWQLRGGCKEVCHNQVPGTEKRVSKPPSRMKQQWSWDTTLHGASLDTSEQLSECFRQLKPNMEEELLGYHGRTNHCMACTTAKFKIWLTPEKPING